jgi:hypothetical protein
MGDVIKKDPTSRPVGLTIVDGRTAAAKYMAKVRAALVCHVGGDPTPLQALIIDQCAALALRINLLDMDFVRGQQAPDVETHVYLGLLNSFDKLRMRLAEVSTARSGVGSEALDGQGMRAS